MPTTAVLIVTFIAVIFGFFIVLFTVLGIRDRRRRQRRNEHGVRTGATVASVESMVPPEKGRLDQPFWLRFDDPDGREHTIRFTSGFEGIVPVEGWRVEVLFEPDDPDNIEITQNPYCHGVSGTEPPPSPVARRWLLGTLAAVTAGLLGWMAVLYWAAIAGDPAAAGERLMLGGGVLFGAAGLAMAGISADVLTTARQRRRRAMVTTGTITHTWSEVRRSSGDDGPSSTTVYPYSVRFALPDGRHVHRRAPDTPNFDRNQPGQQVRVAYQPENPRLFTVGPPGRSLVAPVLTFLFGSVFLGVGVLLAVLA